jgi:excinuclease ABC subunit A
VIYVLDEPSAGLHPQDGQALLAALQRLKASGNSVFGWSTVWR